MNTFVSISCPNPITGELAEVKGYPIIIEGVRYCIVQHHGRQLWWLHRYQDGRDASPFRWTSLEQPLAALSSHRDVMYRTPSASQRGILNEPKTPEEIAAWALARLVGT